jgi:hypothetical protein
MHGKVEERAANSPRCFPATGIDRGGHSASNGGRQSSAHEDGAILVKQIEKRRRRARQLPNSNPKLAHKLTGMTMRWS